MKDWTGTNASLYKTLGASTHSKSKREINDYYATPPKAVEMLLKLEEFNINIWEPACGEGHISKVLKAANMNVYSTDLIDRGYGDGILNFLHCDKMFNGDIITNPPYKYSLEFVKKSLELIHIGSKVAMFLKLQFLEGKKRAVFFTNNPPKTVYVSSGRLLCQKNGNFVNGCDGGAACFCWYIWEKGYRGDTIIKWFN